MIEVIRNMEFFKEDIHLSTTVGTKMGHISLMSFLLVLGIFDFVHRTSNAQGESIFLPFTRLYTSFNTEQIFYRTDMLNVEFH